MFSNNIHGSGVGARGIMALWAMLAMGLGLLASPAAAAPFAYVANSSGNSVSVIDTATNTVVATIPVGVAPRAVAVTPDGKNAYVTNQLSKTVSVIGTATNTVVATVPVGTNPDAVAVTPDGNYVYVANGGTYSVPGTTVSVIATATNTVVATIPVGFAPVGVAVTPDGNHVYVANNGGAVSLGTVSVIDTTTNAVSTIQFTDFSSPVGVAVTPDGKHVYVSNNISDAIWVIDTASNTLVATVSGGDRFPQQVAFTPDGKHGYASFGDPSYVGVIDTATNKVVATVTGGGFGPGEVAVTPDGTHAYVANSLINDVTVIATATNTVVATVPVGINPLRVGIVPPPPGVPFFAFNASLNIAFGSAPNTDAFALGSGFTLSSTAPVFNPLTQPITLQIGTFAVTIPAGSFKKNKQGDFVYSGVTNGVTLKTVVKQTGTLRYTFQAGAQHASLTGTQNAVYVTLAIGGGSFKQQQQQQQQQRRHLGHGPDFSLKARAAERDPVGSRDIPLPLTGEGGSTKSSRVRAPLIRRHSPSLATGVPSERPLAPPSRTRGE